MKKFVHPGIGCTEETLEIMREMVKKGAEPWESYYSGLLKTEYAKLDFAPKLIERIENDADIARFRADCEAAWTHMVIYYAEKDEEYLKLPERIFDWYGEREDFFPKYFTDCHIKLGKYVYTMCAAADMARGKVGGDFIEKLAENALKPIVEGALHCNGYFMNQHTYAIIGALAYSVLTENFELYAEIAEWTLVNKNAENHGRNGALTGVVREVSKNALTGEAVEPIIELVEMGRDQDHAEGNLNNLLMMIRTMEMQKTRFDERGEVAEGGERPICFADNRLLKGFEAYAKYNLGFETPWVPTEAESVGVKVIYDAPSSQGEGNFSLNGFAAGYYAYKALGCDENEMKYTALAYDTLYPYFYETAMSGNFITALHNYAFDFWIGLHSLAEDKKERSKKAREMKDVSFENSGMITAFLNAAGGFGVKMKVKGIAKIEMQSGNKSIMQYVTDSGGDWKKVFFEIDVRRRLFIEVSGDAVFGEFCDAEPVRWRDETKIYDAVLGEACAVDTALEGEEEKKMLFLPEREGKFVFFAEAERNGVSGVKRIEVNVWKSIEEATRSTAAEFDEKKRYEKASLERMRRAEESGNLYEMRKAAGEARLLNPYLSDGSLNWGKICTANEDFAENYMNDDPKVYGSVWNEKQEFIMDFGENFRIRVDEVRIRARGGFPTRVNKSAVYASNDAKEWVKITPEAKITPEMQSLKSESGERWRYVKVKRNDKNDVPVLDIGVLKIFGERYEL
ncbi:MAG: hypothetical protein LUG52_05985 [Clostridia bacterium]|nr:hypothetical protein [Clostridia bacterium]